MKAVNRRFLLFALLILFISQAAHGVSIDLRDLKWYAKRGFDKSYLKKFDVKQSGVKKITNFPLNPNRIFKPHRSARVNQFSFYSEFRLSKKQLKRSKRLSLLLSGIGENWAVYLNGKLLRKEIYLNSSKTRLLRFRNMRNQVVDLPRGKLKKKNRLLFHIVGYPPQSALASNFLIGLHYQEGYVIADDHIVNELRAERIKLILIGIYFFFGLYHFFFFIRRPGVTYNLYFALFSLSLATYFGAFSNEAFDLLSDSRYIILAAYAAQPLALSLFILFLHNFFYSQQRLFWAVRISVLVNLLVVAAILVVEVRYYQTCLVAWYVVAAPQVLYLIFFIIKALVRKLKGSLAMTLSVASMTLFVLFDVFDTIFFNTRVRLLQYGFFVFVFILVTILANQFLELNRETERLNEELIRQKDAFERFVPKQFLQLLGKETAIDIELGDNKAKTMSVLFSDMRDFTGFAERLGPEDAFKLVNNYFAKMELAIEQKVGFVDKYIGDGIMALFGNQDASLPAANRAIDASIQMMTNLKDFNTQRKQSGKQSVRIGIGINTGPVILGTVGSQRRIDTTVIGDTVNLASRLEQLTSYYEVNVIISDYTYRELVGDENYMLREIDSVFVKGKQKPTVIYEVFNNDEDDLRQIKQESQGALALAMALYKSRDFAGAKEHFQKANLDPRDKVPAIFIARCEKYENEPPAENWQGAEFRS